jgi:hypothetical protein
MSNHKRARANPFTNSNTLYLGGAIMGPLRLSLYILVSHSSTSTNRWVSPAKATDTKFGDKACLLSELNRIISLFRFG